MRLSRLFGTRLKEAPADAATPGHALLLRGGYLRPLSPGHFALLPPGLRVAKRIERLLTDALEHLGGQTVAWTSDEPSREEDAASLCRRELNSHAQLPFMIYQLCDRCRRDDARGRGLLDSRVETVLDAFAFHSNAEAMTTAATALEHALLEAFTRMGLIGIVTTTGTTIPDCSSPSVSEGTSSNAATTLDFFLPLDAGEDLYAASPGGRWRASLPAAAPAIPAFPEPPLPLARVHTPGTKTIRELADFLEIETRRTAKAVFYESDREGRLVLVLIRGDREVNEAKLAGIIGVAPAPATEAKIRAAGAEPGFASPLGLDPARVRLIIDETIRASNNLVTGANEPDWHFINFNLARELPGASTADVALAAEGDPSPAGDGPITLRRAVRLGGVRRLGTAIASSHGVTFNDAAGETRHPFMIAADATITRLLTAVIETHHDNFGPRWPAALAPWQVHICALKPDAPGVRETAERIYGELESSGIDVLYDDRNAQPGVQFAEADLLGAPFRLTVGERGLKQGAIEWKSRDTGECGLLPVTVAAATVREWVAAALGKI